MREAELIVPLIISFAMMALMLRAFTMAQVAAAQRVRSSLPVRVTTDNASYCCSSLKAGLDTTAARLILPEDERRAMHVAEKARTVLERYKGHTLALADGYKMDLPGNSGTICRFTNYWYSFKAGFDFDPEHPTSLLYEKTASGSYKLVGAMFTAPARFSEDQLNERIPLSVAKWHRHATFGWMTVVYPFEKDLNAMWSEKRPMDAAA